MALAKRRLDVRRGQHVRLPRTRRQSAGYTAWDAQRRGSSRAKPTDVFLHQIQLEIVLSVEGRRVNAEHEFDPPARRNVMRQRTAGIIALNEFAIRVDPPVREVNAMTTANIGKCCPARLRRVFNADLDRDLLIRVERQRRGIDVQSRAARTLWETSGDRRARDGGGRFRHGAMTWQLENEQAARLEHSQQLGEVARAEMRFHVLEHEGRVREGEARGVEAA